MLPREKGWGFQYLKMKEEWKEIFRRKCKVKRKTNTGWSRKKYIFCGGRKNKSV
jgi:hypothetical protein